MIESTCKGNCKSRNDHGQGHELEDVQVDVDADREDEEHRGHRERDNDLAGNKLRGLQPFPSRNGKMFRYEKKTSL